MEEKNIDRLFQEKFKDLEVTPSDAVWNTIEAKLTNKKKKRVFPIWWLSSGVAAILVLGLLLYPYGNKQEVIEKIDTVVESTPSEIKENKNVQKDIVPTKPTKEALNETQIVKAETNSKSTKNSSTKAEEILATNQNVKVLEKKSQKTGSKIADNAKETLLAKNNDIKQEDTSNISLKIDTKEEHLKKKNDSLRQHFKKKKDFLAAIEKEEEKPKEKIKKKQWSVAPTVAVLNSNSFTASSPIDESLSNSTQGNTSYSYGVQVAYQLNKKWTIQSGVHLQEMIYSNTNVAVNPVISSSSNIDFNSGKNYELYDASQLNSNAVSLTSGSLDGALNQKYGYVEIPFEVKYSVFENRKLKTQLVAGFSSLFLNKNDVNLTTSTFSNSGEATNLNNINFSGNLGVDVNYQFSKNWSLNINPMLKTQLNTFEKNSNGFQPYFIGVYSGISYQF